MTGILDSPVGLIEDGKSTSISTLLQVTRGPMAELNGDFESASGDNPADGPDGSVTALLGQLKNCPSQVLEEIWRRFFPRMAGLARRTLLALPKCPSDADDVAQNAFLSFWNILQADRTLELAGRDDLWRLLAVLTVRKARRMARYESAQKRGGAATRNESEFASIGGGSAFQLGQALGHVSPPEFDLFCEEMLLGLNEHDRTIAVLRMHGHSTSEIAEKLQCSPRSIQRALVAIRDLWKQAADDG